MSQFLTLYYVHTKYHALLSYPIQLIQKKAQVSKESIGVIIYMYVFSFYIT